MQRRVRLSGAAALLLWTGCFVGGDTLGRPCVDDDDCSTSLVCRDDRCRAPDEGSGGDTEGSGTDGGTTGDGDGDCIEQGNCEPCGQGGACPQGFWCEIGPNWCIPACSTVPGHCRESCQQVIDCAGIQPMISRAVGACSGVDETHECAGPASELGQCLAEVECSTRDVSDCLPLAQAMVECAITVDACPSLPGSNVCRELCVDLQPCGGPDLTASVLARCILATEDPECMAARDVFECYRAEACEFIMNGGAVPNPGVCIGEIEMALMTCPWVTCGDGYVLGPEDCDDGNIVDGDGCSSTCR